MSLLPLGGIIGIGLAFFYIKLPVEDVAYAKVAGEDIPGAPVVRMIDAAVDPSRSESLEMIFGGRISDGDIGIYTQSALLIQDEGETTQSYVTYRGLVYRVAEAADWVEQAGVTVYLGKRHVAQN